MDSVRVTRKIWIVLSSIIIPGLGHWIAGRRDKAIFIISTFLFHLSLAYTLLHMVVIEQPVSVAYLLLAIPYHYFYGIYNSLQSLHDQRHMISRIQRVLGILIFIAALLLWTPLDWLYPYKHFICNTYPSILLLSTTAYYLLRLRNRNNGKLLLLRISAAISMLLFVVLLNLQQFVPIQWRNWMLMLPIIVVLELVFLAIYRNYREQKLRYSVDVRSTSIAAILIVVAYFVIQYSDYPSQLLESFHAPSVTQEQLDGEEGFNYELPPIIVSAPDEYSTLQLRHLNGHVQLTSGDVNEITIYPELFVATDDEDEALNVKEQAKIEVLFDEKLSIVTSLPSYRINHYPRMNINIVLPKKERFLDAADIRVEHGRISISKLVFFDLLKVESNTATIDVQSIIGPIMAVSKSGNIYMQETVSNIEAQTKKGDIIFLEPTRSIKATTLNGDIAVQTNRILGDWDLTATVGSIMLTLPKDANYRLNAEVSFGQISREDSNLLESKELHYVRGNGRFGVDLYASNYIILREDVQGLGL